jgi:squalene-hopene/tetraprenyl-beta-curcumene cyclase
MRIMISSTLGLALLAPPAFGAEPDDAKVKAAVEQARAFLKSRQGDDGSFSPKFGGPGITALVVAGLVRHGVSPDDPMVAKSLKYLESNIKPDGGIYSKGLANYTTCVSLVALNEANQNGRYDAVIANAAKYLKTLQSDPGDESETRFGGVSYGGKEQPDMSNTHFFVEALKSAGVANNDPAVQRALKFISRCQNLPGETNDRPFAKKTTQDDKGGLIYKPADGDDPKSNNLTPDGGLRSVGTMTYAGLKSFLYAGLTKNDPRVTAAVDWIRRHYTLDENPGAGTAGLYYYYHLFAKAMTALGEATLTDAQGKSHHWRAELAATLLAKQKPDGSWANANRQFLEDNPDLATAYAILALSYCRVKK